MFFDSWQGLGRVLVVSVLAYVALVVLVRLSGKRSLAQMNAFDFVVTVALGSILATIPLSSDVALAEGILTFAVFLALQFVITWSSVRSAMIRRAVKAEPTLLYYQGEMLSTALKAQRVTADEVRAAMRSQGVGRAEEVDAVILENNGSFSIIRARDGLAMTALKDVPNYPPDSQST